MAPRHPGTAGLWPAGLYSSVVRTHLVVSEDVLACSLRRPTPVLSRTCVYPMRWGRGPLTSPSAGTGPFGATSPSRSHTHTVGPTQDASHSTLSKAVAIGATAPASAQGTAPSVLHSPRHPAAASRNHHVIGIHLSGDQGHTPLGAHAHWSPAGSLRPLHVSNSCGRNCSLRGYVAEMTEKQRQISSQ